MWLDWSLDLVMIDGVEMKVKVAHFKLSQIRKSFVVAYPRETREMLLRKGSAFIWVCLVLY